MAPPPFRRLLRVPRERRQQMGENTISEDRVSVARHHVYWRCYRHNLNRADELKTADAKADALENVRAAQVALDLIGWPDDDDHDVEDVDPVNLALIREAVIGGLGSDAEELAESVWRLLSHPETPLDTYHRRHFEAIDDAWRLLEEIGWELS